MVALIISIHALTHLMNTFLQSRCQYSLPHSSMKAIRHTEKMTDLVLSAVLLFCRL